MFRGSRDAGRAREASRALPPGVQPSAKSRNDLQRSRIISRDIGEDCGSADGPSPEDASRVV